MLVMFLLPVAFPLSPGVLAGEIIGGQEAKPHSRPYMAYVQIGTGGRGTGHCGGFLIRLDLVVTAAHCNCNLGTITVLLAAHNVAKREWGRQEIQVRRRIPHPEYNDETKENDIMLLQLAQRAKRNRWVKTIPLPHSKNTVKLRTNCSVAGWGRTSKDNQRLSDTLQEVDVEVLKDDECPRTPNGLYRHYNSSTMLCVGDPEQDKDSAVGDSGGPLVCEGTVQGIVSFGSEDGTPPGVYTRVSAFVPWIQATIKKLQPPELSRNHCRGYGCAALQRG